MNTTQCRRAGRAAMSHGCTTRFPLLACTAAMVLCPTALGLGDPEDVGRWDPPEQCAGYDQYEWETSAISAIHLPSDEVLFWRRNGPSNHVWTAASGCFTPVFTDERLFCSGHVALSNGSILVAGGLETPGMTDGIKQVLIYRLGGMFGGPWDTDVAWMNHARWYPTCTALPDGKVLAISGRDETGQPMNVVGIPEIYDPEHDVWTDMGSGADKDIPVYPFMFVLPDDGDGRVFYAGSHGAVPNNDGTTYILYLDTPPSWSDAITSIPTARGAAVMYEPGNILRCGGDDLDAGLVTRVTQIIDLSDPASPLPASWDTDLLWNMTTARRFHNLVLLADGTILAVGGENEVGAAVNEAELFDPNEAFPAWQPMATMVKPRKDHSTALLLPDATVLAAGLPDGAGATAEIYSPAYLFDANGVAPQPLIGVAPTDVTYGSVFSVILSGTSPVPVNEIQKVSFVRLGSTTHGFDMDQRYVPLGFVVSGTHTLDVTAPADGNFAPPGYYMLFLISDTGVPSIAKYVRLFATFVP